jgi:hypothetical protein
LPLDGFQLSLLILMLTMFPPQWRQAIGFST